MNTYSATNYLEQKWLETLKGQSFLVSTVYIGLFTSTPTESSKGTEPSGGAYKRMKVTFSSVEQVEDKGVIYNDRILFDVATSGWGTITHVGLFDAETNGNMLFYGALDVPKTVISGDEVRVNAKDLSVSVG